LSTVYVSFLQSSAVKQVLDIPLLYLHIVLSAAVYVYQNIMSSTRIETKKPDELRNRDLRLRD